MNSRHGDLNVNERRAAERRAMGIPEGSVSKWTDEELAEAAQEYGRRRREESKAREAEATRQRRQRYDAAWAKTLTELRDELAEYAVALDDDDFYTIYAAIRDFYEKWG